MQRAPFMVLGCAAALCASGCRGVMPERPEAESDSQAALASGAQRPKINLRIDGSTRGTTVTARINERGFWTLIASAENAPERALYIVAFDVPTGMEQRPARGQTELTWTTAAKLAGMSGEFKVVVRDLEICVHSGMSEASCEKIEAQETEATKKFDVRWTIPWEVR